MISTCGEIKDAPIHATKGGFHEAYQQFLQLKRCSKKNQLTVIRLVRNMHNANKTPSEKFLVSYQRRNDHCSCPRCCRNWGRGSPNSQFVSLNIERQQRFKLKSKEKSQRTRYTIKFRHSHSGEIRIRAQAPEL